MTKNYVKFLQIPLFFVFSLILPSKIYAQCAGDDAQKVICDIYNPVYKSISLFSLLGGTPTPGGTWTDDDNSKGLNTATGELNGQLIRKGGVYHYTYTVANAAGCIDDKAVVTITIGAYAGVPAPFATVCSSKKTFNLFTAFNSTVMGPHSNGTWKDSKGNAVGSTIPIAGLEGSFQFTYTVPAVIACSPIAPTSTITVTIFRAPEAGEGQELVLCGTTGLAGYTDLDLHTLLSNEESGGEWRGVGLTSFQDNTINLQEVFDNNGPGTYNYTYTVLAYPNNIICPDETSVISIVLEKQLDFTGAKLDIESDICEDKITTAVYSAKITQGPQVIPDGEYEIAFVVSGPNGGTETIKANFVNGEVSFPIKSSYFKQVGAFRMTVTNIISTISRKACANIVTDLFYDLKINPLPRLDNAVLTSSPTCQNKDASVDISNIVQLVNGPYTIVYNLSGDNTAAGQTANFRVADGKANFKIPAALNIKSGVSKITIIRITNAVTGCTNNVFLQGDLIINPLPNAVTVKIQIENVCFNDPVPAVVSGLGNLTDAVLSYTLSDSNISTLQTVALKVVNGNASFIIPAGLLVNTGSTTILASNLMNAVTFCDINLSNIFDTFIINPIPAAPLVNNPQTFCKVDGATIANLSPRGSQYKWYNSAAATTPLADTYLLKSESLYVRETSAANCTSAPTTVSIVINDTPAPVLNPGGADFCGLKNPTISDLSKVTNVSSTVTWYDAKENGNLLKSTTLLVHNAVYYGYDLSTITDCISDNYLEVAVSLKDCDVAEFDFFIPDGFSPNGDNVNDTFRIPDIEFLYPDYSLEIFNRYGNVMFKGNINKPNWDGRNSESAGFGDGIAANGVYFYIINFNKDNKPPKQGRLYLNR